MWSFVAPGHHGYQRFTNTVAALEKELAADPRVFALGLYPHLIGVTHRIGYLEMMVDDILTRDDTVFMTGSQIADRFIAAGEPPTAAD